MPYYKDKTCKECQAKYLDVDWIPARVKGYCSKDCFDDAEKLRFEKWYVDCAMIGLKNPIVPDSYEWGLKLKSTAKFKVFFEAGLSPDEAVDATFNTAH